jgi:hypothetical protein
MDTYPDEKRTVNILTIMFECGLVQKIKSKPMLGNNDFQAMLLQLENEYGIVSKYSDESIRIWADALSVAIQATNKQTSAPVAHEPIVHKPIVDSITVEGCKSDYETKVENGSITITKFIGFDEKEIIVPNIIDGLKVTTIGESAFSKCTGIEKIVISEGITEIHNGAFFGCTALKDVVLPTTLRKLGKVPSVPKGMYSWQWPRYEGVFENCAITEIQLPPSLGFIGGKAFRYCRNLQKMNLPNGIKSLQEECFYGCTSLSEVLLPDNLHSIGCDAFGGSGLLKIDIPSTVSKIEKHAFRNCEKMSSVILHEGLNTIEDRAFENCKSLCAITIPNSVTAIGQQVFDITGWYQPYDRRRKGWSTREKSKDLVIACYAGSYGLDYARKEGYQIKNAAK